MSADAGVSLAFMSFRPAAFATTALGVSQSHPSSPQPYCLSWASMLCPQDRHRLCDVLIPCARSTAALPICRSLAASGSLRHIGSNAVMSASVSGVCARYSSTARAAAPHFVRAPEAARPTGRRQAPWWHHSPATGRPRLVAYRRPAVCRPPCPCQHALHRFPPVPFQQLASIRQFGLLRAQLGYEVVVFLAGRRVTTSVARAFPSPISRQNAQWFRR